MKNNFKLKNVTIGSDLELFIVDKETGELASAIGVFGGTKEEPKYIGNLCYIQEDNILMEANIPPVTSFTDFRKYIKYIKDYVTDNYPQFALHYSSSEVAPFHLLLDEKARVFGCDPVNIVDYNDSGDTIPEQDFDAGIAEKMFSPIRVGGFHIHFGYDDPNPEVSREIVKLFERNVTLKLLKRDHDPQNRRQFYGKAGEYRIKPYGLECRSLGSSLLKDEHLEDVWNCVQDTVRQFNQGERVSKQEFQIIKEIINTNKLEQTF